MSTSPEHVVQDERNPFSWRQEDPWTVLHELAAPVEVLLTIK